MSENITTSHTFSNNQPPGIILLSSPADKKVQLTFEDSVLFELVNTHTQKQILNY